MYGVSQRCTLTPYKVQLLVSMTARPLKFISNCVQLDIMCPLSRTIAVTAVSQPRLTPRVHSEPPPGLSTYD